MKSIRDVLRSATARLQKHNISNPQLDARLLMQHALNCSHEDLLLRLDSKLDANQNLRFQEYLQERSLKKPLSYITGTKEFFSKEFIVNKYTLIPRPDTEIIVEYCLTLFTKEQRIQIIDIGTGSGCIAICLANYYKNAAVTATDCSEQALKIAKQNAKRHLVDVNFVQDKNFALGLKEEFDLIVSNPPYIKSAIVDQLEDDVKIYEPRTALDGGLTGLDAYKKIIQQSHSILKPKGRLVFEIGIDQQDEVIDIAVENGFKNIGQIKDLAGIIRCVSFTKI